MCPFILGIDKYHKRLRGKFRLKLFIPYLKLGYRTIKIKWINTISTPKADKRVLGANYKIPESSTVYSI